MATNWTNTVHDVRNNASWRCECDGICSHPHNGRCQAQSGDFLPNGKVVILHIAYLDDDSDNRSLDNLMALCHDCHRRWMKGKRARVTELRAEREAKYGVQDPIW